MTTTASLAVRIRLRSVWGTLFTYLPPTSPGSLTTPCTWERSSGWNRALPDLTSPNPGGLPGRTCRPVRAPLASGDRARTPSPAASARGIVSLSLRLPLHRAVPYPDADHVLRRRREAGPGRLDQLHREVAEPPVPHGPQVAAPPGPPCTRRWGSCSTGGQRTRIRSILSTPGLSRHLSVPSNTSCLDRNSPGSSVATAAPSPTPSSPRALPRSLPLVPPKDRGGVEERGRRRGG